MQQVHSAVAGELAASQQELERAQAALAQARQRQAALEDELSRLRSGYATDQEALRHVTADVQQLQAERTRLPFQLAVAPGGVPLLRDARGQARVAVFGLVTSEDGPPALVVLRLTF